MEQGNWVTENAVSAALRGARRIDRYAELTAIINRWPPFPSYTPAMEWLIAALRAHQ